MRWLVCLALLPAFAFAEQEVYLEHARRGIEVYLPRGAVPQLPYISAYEVELVRAEVARVPEKFRSRFGPRYEGWRATWAGGPPAVASPEFYGLARMGRAIMPLIIEQLLIEDQAPALALYDQVAPLEFFVGTPQEESLPAPVAQRLRALRTVRRWLELARKDSYRRHD